MDASPSCRKNISDNEKWYALKIKKTKNVKKTMQKNEKTQKRFV